MTEAIGFVPEVRLPELIEKLSKVNKQAAKIGVPAFVIEKTGVTKEEVIKVTRDAAGKEVKHTATFIELKLTGEIPRLPGGFELLGVISFEESLPIIRTVPEKVVPVNQRERGPICDHCSVLRKRNETFVVQSEAGVVKTVGRQCLADFLGLSAYAPEALLEVLSFLRDWLEGEEGEYNEPGEGGSYGELRIPVEEIIEIAGACIDAFGWVSKGREQAAYGAVIATSSDVQRYLYPPQIMTAAYAEFAEKVTAKRTAELKAEVQAALAWAKPLRGNMSDYLNNLGTIACLESIGARGRNMGITVSLIAAYRREQDKLRDQERKVRNAGHFGTIGKRETFTLKLVTCRAIEGNYGTTFRTEFETPEGFTAVWWASYDPTEEHCSGAATDPPWVKGEPYEAKATVKKHDEWKGLKQTLLSRVARVFEMPPKPKKPRKPRKPRVVAPQLEETKDHENQP